MFYICGGAFTEFMTETGITNLGRHPEPAVSAEALGIVPALARRIRAVMRVPPLDEATLARLVPCVDFTRLVGGDTRTGQ